MTSTVQLPLVSWFTNLIWESTIDSAVPDTFALVHKPLHELADGEKTRIQGILCGGLQHPMDRQLMASFPNLRVISNIGVGVNHIDLAAATDRGIAVGNTPHVVSDCTADMTFALLLASARNVVQGDHITKSPDTVKFDVNWHGVKVTGSTLGIIGLGNIGKAVAKRAKGFDMRILYHNRNRIPEANEHALGAEYCARLDDLLRQADFVMLAVPLSPQTKHLISARELNLMKPTATLINVARGAVVNQNDLVEALESGQIHGAALDVTQPEPLPRDHPLLKLSNVIITPHIGTATVETRERMMTMAVSNLVAGLKGKKLPNPVN